MSIYDKMSCLNVNKDVNLKLDPTLWKKLPLDVTNHIFKFLPLHVLFQLRLVCKHWNALSIVDHFCNSFVESYLIRFENRKLEGCDVYDLNN